MLYARRELALAFIATVFALSLIGGAIAFAQEPDVSFPIAELGGCTDKGECKAYCDDIAHLNECVSFAETHGLMSNEEAAHARAFAAVGSVGPGGCTSMDSCEDYCEDTSHIDECIVFGEANGLIPQEELAEAKKMAAALKSGASLPGGCTSKRQCESYCSDAAHMRECITFGESAGLIPPEELAEARKVADYLESGGTMPGGCRGKGECESYCEKEANAEECMNFALKAGFVSDKEAEIIKKTGGKGPGGCRGRACETFCKDPANRQVCTEFAMQYGLMSEEEQRQMKEGAEQVQKMLSDAPSEVIECIRGAVGDENIDKVRSGTYLFGPESGDTIKNCFETYYSKRDAENGGHRSPRPEGEVGLSPRQIQMPPEIVACAQSIFGGDFLDGLESGAINQNEFEEQAKACVAQMHPRSDSESSQYGSPPPGTFPPPEYMPGDFEGDRGSFEGVRPEGEFQEQFDVHSGPSGEEGNFEIAPQEPAPIQEPVREPVQETAPAPSPEPSSSPSETSLGAQVISALKSLLGR